MLVNASQASTEAKSIVISCVCRAGEPHESHPKSGDVELKRHQVLALIPLPFVRRPHCIYLSHLERAR